MIRFDVSLDVSRPPAEVFAFLDEEANAPKWLSRCAHLSRKSSGPKGVGTRLLYRYKEGSREGEMDGEVITYEPNRRLAMKYVDKMMHVTVGFDVQPEGTGSRIVHSIQIEPQMFLFKLMTPIIRSATRKQTDKDTATLKRLLDAG